MKNNKKLVGAALLAAAGVGAYFAWKRGVFNFSNGATAGYEGYDLPGLDPSKARAQRWLESQLQRDRHLDIPRAEVIDQSMAMESGRVELMNTAIKRLKGDAVTYEHVSPWGVGRPE